MTIRNLEGAVRPQSIAVIGASDSIGSVGRVVMKNITTSGFSGNIWPVNPKYQTVAELPCHAKVADLPEVPDFAVVMTPPSTIPGIIKELGEAGCRAAVVITAGLTSENGLKQAMLDAAEPYLFRIIGPNTIGLLVPPAGLNASFSHIAPRPGGVALLSQSGAIVTSLIDWAAEKAIGFSQIVSLGDMADVDVGDYLDLLAGDISTKAIVLYLESIPEPRKFLSAARAAARAKPVIAVKSGRHVEAAKAALTHTGALSGADRVTDAALRRAGILRVRDLDALFGATEIVSRYKPLTRARTTVVTNGGGAGVLVVDQLVDRGSILAEIAQTTIQELDNVLPANWSRANPIDIIGDAPPERYVAAVVAASNDPQTDVIIVMNCPTALASPVEAARAVAGLAENGMIGGKPVLACWLGGQTARLGRELLEAAGIASFETPAEVAAAVSYLVDWSRAQAQLMRVPESLGGQVEGCRKKVQSIFEKAAGEGRSMLTEPEAKAAIAAYGLTVPETRVATSLKQVEEMASAMLKTSDRIAVKLLSKTISHKSDVGGVVLNVETVRQARLAASGINRRLAALFPGTKPDGYSIQPMIERKQAHELIVGVSLDPVFGPVILFGAGGVAVEVIDDTAIGLPPLDTILAGDLIDATRISRLLAGFRDRKPAKRGAIIAALIAVSDMIVDFPCIQSMDINPLLADSDGVIALDARIQIDPPRIDETGPNPSLAIRPCPSGWQRTIHLGGRDWLLRPIIPADVALYPDFMAKISPDDVRFRFLAPRRHFPDQMLLRLTQLDYDREMAFVLLDAETGELAGIARLSADPDRQKAEYAILVRSDLQGRGLGWRLMAQLIEYASADGLKTIEGMILAANSRMIEMCRTMGFQLQDSAEQSGAVVATLELPATFDLH